MAASPAAQTATRPIIIRDAGQLIQLAEEWCRLPAVAIDTEFERRRTFHSVPALVQIADGQRCCLVDPLILRDFSPLRRLLEAPDTLKVLHACREDIQVLQQLAGASPEPLFDTQLAAAFLGDPPQVGYRHLVERRLGITVPDGETCSDWLQRPLRPAQVHYAAEDVRWLLPLYRELERDLKREQRLDWVLEDCARIPELLQPEKTLQAMLQRLSGSCQSVQARERLRLLCAFREAKASQENIPRSWLMKDELLVLLANHPPGFLAEMAALPGFPPRLSRRWGRELLQLLTRPQTAAPEETTRAPANDDCRALEQSIRQGVAERARSLSLSPGLLLSRQECRQAARAVLKSGALPERLQGGWRHSLLGDLLRG